MKLSDWKPGDPKPGDAIIELAEKLRRDAETQAPEVAAAMRGSAEAHQAGGERINQLFEQGVALSERAEEMTRPRKTWGLWHLLAVVIVVILFMVLPRLLA